MISAQRLRLEIDVPRGEIRGRAEIWVASSSSSLLRLNCRGLVIHSVRVDGEEQARVSASQQFGWRHRDPLLPHRETETMLRASMYACSQGELEIDLPSSSRHAVTIDYFGGFQGLTTRGCEERSVFGKYAATIYPQLGSALASIDFDGVRCWMPCVDREPTRHPWRLDFGVVTRDDEHSCLVAASGNRVVAEDDDSFFGDGVKAKASFVADGLVPARAIGFAVLTSGYDAVSRSIVPGTTTTSQQTTTIPATPRLTRVDSSARESGGSSRSRLLTRVDSSRRAVDQGCGVEVECYYPDAFCDAETASEIAGKIADAAQFWRSWFATATTPKTKRMRSSSIGLAEDGDGPKSHSVVLVENMEVPFVPCVGLTLVDARLARRSTSRYDSMTRDANAESLALALFSSFALEELAVRDADADEWILHAIVGAVTSRFVDRAHNKLGERLVSLSRSALSGGGTRPLSLVGENDAPSWWRALEMRQDANGDAERWFSAKSTLVAHALESRIGRSTVRRAVGRLRELCCASSNESRFLTAASSSSSKRTGYFQLSTSRFLRACALEQPLAMASAAQLAGADNGSVDSSLPDDQLALATDETVAEFRTRWIETVGSSVLECDYFFNKHMLEVNVEQRVDDQRSFSEPATHLPICVRVVEREDTREYYKYLDAIFHKWEFKTALLPSTETKVAAASAETAPQQDDRNNASSRDDEGISVESVMDAARTANQGGPVLYVRFDPDHRLCVRSVDVKQPEHAWIEQVFGDEDVAAQLDAVAALSACLATPAKSMADKMLAARCLACVLRGVNHPVSVRCDAARALADWQRRECATDDSAAISRFGAAQLWRAFDERFKKDGFLRPAAFRSDVDGSADQLALKTALAAAFGSISDSNDARAWPHAADRCLELVRDHFVEEDDADGLLLSNEIYVSTALRALGAIATKGDDQWLGEAIKQARRYLDWHLSIDRQDAVAASALEALHSLLRERARRRSAKAQQQAEDWEKEVVSKESKTADEFLRRHREGRTPELVRITALKLESAGREYETASLKRGFARRELQATRLESMDRDQARQVLAGPDVAYDQRWRVCLLRRKSDEVDEARVKDEDEERALPEPLLPVLNQVRSDRERRRGPKRQRYVRDLDISNPDVLKKIKINFTATASRTSPVPLPPPSSPVANAPSSGDLPSETRHQHEEQQQQQRSGAIRPIVIRQTAPIDVS